MTLPPKVILCLALFATISAFSHALRAQDESACTEEGKIFKVDHTLYCVNIIPPSEECRKSPRCVEDQMDRVASVHDLIDLRGDVVELEQMAPGSENTPGKLEKMERKIDRLCKRNSCNGIPFSGFPHLVQLSRFGFLEFIRVAAARSVYDAAESDRINLTYSSRLRQMLEAVHHLRRGDYEPEVALQ